jgi:hypothetical protein
VCFSANEWVHYISFFPQTQIYAGEVSIDLGGHFVHGVKGDVVFTMASQYQLLTNYEESKPDIIFIDSSGNLVNKTRASEFYHLLNNIRDSKDRELQNYPGSLGEYFNQQ